jgi:hypothetical protein
MPLAFSSLSHGTVAFGFFNIETDCLLLDRLFFFCTDFCRAVGELAETAASNSGKGESSLRGYTFARSAEIGDLMGAIQGTRHVGFLGDVYRLWPFPAEPEGFRQKRYGARNREPVEALLRARAIPVPVALVAERAGGPVRIGEYTFSRRGFRDLLDYVLRGGHPTWEGYEKGQRPECVAELVEAAQALGEGRSPGT